jgi:hypothetical protein
LLAAFLAPLHVSFPNPRLFKCEVSGEHLEDRGLKEGWQRMRLVKELVFNKPTAEQHVKFGILCALEANTSKDFALWAKNWLNGTDRSAKSADYAAADAAAHAAADAAANAAAYAAYYAADAAANAAYAAAKGGKNIDFIRIAKMAMET